MAAPAPRLQERQDTNLMAVTSDLDNLNMSRENNWSFRFSTLHWKNLPRFLRSLHTLPRICTVLLLICETLKMSKLSKLVSARTTLAKPTDARWTHSMCWARAGLYRMRRSFIWDIPNFMQKLENGSLYDMALSLKMPFFDGVLWLVGFTQNEQSLDEGTEFVIAHEVVPCRPFSTHFTPICFDAIVGQRIFRNSSDYLRRSERFGLFGMWRLPGQRPVNDGGCNFDRDLARTMVDSEGSLKLQLTILYLDFQSFVQVPLIMLEHLEFLSFLSNDGHDLEIVTLKLRIRAHKIILFKKLPHLKSKFVDSGLGNRLVWKTNYLFEREITEQIEFYINVGRVTLYDAHSAIKLHAAARTFGMSKLEEMCLNFFFEIYEFKRFLFPLMCFAEQAGSSRLREMCVKAIAIKLTGFSIDSRATYLE